MDKRTWVPVLPRAKVGCGRNTAGLEALDGTAGCHDDTQTSRATNGLLTGGDNAVDAPVVELDLFATDTAHTVDNDEGVRADSVDKLADVLDLAENACGGVDVGNGNSLVLLLAQSLFDLIQLWALAYGCFELCGLDSVCLEAVGKAVGKVAGVQDEDIVTGLDQVGGDLIPAKSSGARDDKGLSGGVLGLEQGSEHLESLAKRLDEWHSDVRLAASYECKRGTAVGRERGEEGGSEQDVPEVAHGLQDLVIEFDGAWDEQGGMGRLARHVGSRLIVLLWGCGGREMACGGVGEVVGRTGLPLCREWSVQLELRSLVEMSRDETEPSLGSQLEGRGEGGAAGNDRSERGSQRDDDIGK